jgi:hypothetical protein
VTMLHDLWIGQLHCFYEFQVKQKREKIYTSEWNYIQNSSSASEISGSHSNKHGCLLVPNINNNTEKKKFSSLFTCLFMKYSRMFQSEKYRAICINCPLWFTLLFPCFAKRIWFYSKMSELKRARLCT